MIEAARPADRAEIESLLRRCDLPLDGVAGHLAHFLVARAQGRIIGCAGLELHGDACVVRSLAVDPQERGRRVGRRLMTAVLERAREAGCTDAYGLTLTAERMMSRMGFSRMSRAEVPEAILSSPEFNLSCCASAAVIHKFL